MAGVIVPILGAVVPQVIPLVVRLLDKIFPSKTGQAKLDAGAEIVGAIQQGLQNSKALASTPLSGDQIKAAVQSAVDTLNAQGQLKGAATVVEQTSPAVTGLADLLIHIGTVMKG